MCIRCMSDEKCMQSFGHKVLIKEAALKIHEILKHYIEMDVKETH